jgi:hypothetical protein
VRLTPEGRRGLAEMFGVRLIEDGKTQVLRRA